MSIFLLGAGNLLSMQQARGVNPDSVVPLRRRRARAGDSVGDLSDRVRARRTGVPGALRADSEAAFFGVLAIDAVVGGIVYNIALESAVESAASDKEKVLAALAAGDGPISG